MAARALIPQALDVYRQIVSCFPKQHLRLAFAYGSGVFKQRGNDDPSKNMLDFIFVVDEPLLWHQDNLARHRTHYSCLKYGGAKVIRYVQEEIDAGVYFNTLVKCEGQLVKYGVVSTTTVIKDLLDWDSLYISGRLHKPVKVVASNPVNMMSDLKLPTSLQAAMDANLGSAVHTSLLMLDEKFTETNLYETITSLSYTGDFRMQFAEDMNKVRNIVQPNVEHFRRLYEPILDQEKDHLHWNKAMGTMEQPLQMATQYRHLSQLPRKLQTILVAQRNLDGRAWDTEEVMRSYAELSGCEAMIRAGVRDIVKWPCRCQSIKSIFTAGVMKSAKYSWQKWKKGRKSRKTSALS